MIYFNVQWILYNQRYDKSFMSFLSTMLPSFSEILVNTFTKTITALKLPKRVEIASKHVWCRFIFKGRRFWRCSQLLSPCCYFQEYRINQNCYLAAHGIQVKSPVDVCNVNKNFIKNVFKATRTLVNYRLKNRKKNQPGSSTERLHALRTSDNKLMRPHQLVFCLYTGKI